MVVKVLLALNVIVYVAWNTMGDSTTLLADNFTVSSGHLASLRFWTLLTSGFSHYGFEHLLFNMYALWLFGRPVALIIGSRAFAHLYVAGAIVASIGHVAYNIVSGDPTPALGASGAVMAISTVFALMFPKVRLLLFFLIPLPAIAAVALFALIDVMGMVSGGSSIAHAAHLGGLLYGLVYYVLDIRPKLRRRRT